MFFEEEWDDLLDFRFGPFRIGTSLRPFKMRYRSTRDSHIIKLRLDPGLKKEEIKVRLLKGGILEIEWPKKIEAEEIEVE
jgi:HSP20 family molecular chaperone IbpA